MVAGIALTTPQPPPGAAETSSDVSREDAEAFAAHLPQETQTKPAPRKPVASETQETSEKEETVAASSFSPPLLSAPAPEVAAPTTLDLALAPAAASTQPTAAQIAPDAVSAPASGIAAPSIDIASPQAAKAAPPPQAAVPENAAATTPQPVSPAAAQIIPVVAETIAATAATPVKAAALEAPTASLRTAGRSRGGKAEAQANGETRPVSAVAASAQAGARPDAKPEFIAASASGPASRPMSGDASLQPAAMGEAVAVSLEARRAAEAPALAVHRPPTIAATVAQHVIRRFDGKSTSIDVRLDPAELGRVSVKLDVGADNRVTAIVAADNPATLSDLMRSARELERALESAGLELAHGGLSFDLSGRGSRDSKPANDASASNLRAGNDNAAPSTDAMPASRPFGLESWRGVRVDVTV